MLKTRIIPTLLIQNSSVVKTINFNNPRIVGDAFSTAKVFSERMADEMIIVDIDAHKRNTINSQLFKKISKYCNMPLTLGGGIKNLEDAEKFFRSGADKIVINSGFQDDPDLIKKLSNKYGNQSIVFSLDVKKENNSYYCFSNSGQVLYNHLACELAVKVVEDGAGEILLNNIDGDGMMNGYNLDLIEVIANKVRVPVIASGGCGSKKDFLEAINSGANAASAASIFFWIGESVISIKKYLQENNLNVRIN